MNTRSLNIGNWFRIDDVEYVEPMRIDGFVRRSGSLYAQFMDGKIEADISTLIPIELTEDILEECDFDPFEVTWYRNITSSDNEWHINCISVKYDVYTTIRYVHELQNILNMCDLDYDVKLK